MRPMCWTRAWLATWCFAELVVPALAFDIVADANHIMVMALIVVGLYFLYLYRDRVITLLTGDDRLHFDLNSTLWQLITCCGTCECEWTRSLTSSSCWPFRSSKGKNLLRLLGQTLGVAQIPIELTNIVVGDVPATRAGDYYLTVETSSNPPQITAVVENCEPKVVAFPDTLIIKVRSSPLESNVRFCVKKMHSVGSEDICDCYVSPKMLLYWMVNEDGAVRIRMEPCRKNYTFPLPAWILLDIQEHSKPSRGLGAFDLTIQSSRTGELIPYQSAADFKQAYELLDSSGFRSQEPDEAKLANIDRFIRAKAVCVRQLFLILLIVSGAFMSSHFYCGACFQRYSEIAVINNFGVLFPVLDHKARFYRERCNLDKNLFVDMIEKDVLAGQKLTHEKVDPNCTVTLQEIL